MKNRILFTIAITALCFSACKKDPLDIPLGIISVSISGNSTTFNVQSKASRTNSSGNNILTIEGYKKDPATSSTKVKLIISSPALVVAGTFSENTAPGNPIARIEHFQELIFGIGTSYVSYGSGSNPVTITITSISSSSVKGKFQGELQVPIVNGAGEKVLLNSGVFNVSF